MHTRRTNSLLLFGKRRSISRDLTISLVTLVLAVSSIFSIYSYHSRSNQLLESLNAKADEAVDKATEVLALPLWNLDTTSVRMVGMAFAQNEEVEAVRIADARGKLLFELYKGRGKETISRSREVVYNDIIIGNAEISYSMDAYHRQMDNLLWSTLFTVLVTVGVVLLATGLLLGVLLRKPLEKLRQGTRRVAEGEYGDSLEVAHAELEGIANDFNEMSAAVASREADLNRMNLELRRAEAKYHSIFENAIEGIFQTTIGGAFLNANPSLADILGYDSPDELINEIHDVVNQVYVNAEDRDHYVSLLNESGKVTAYEVQLLRRDGSRIWASISAQLIRDRRGRVRYIEGSLVDITVRKKMEDELRHRALHDPLTGLANRVLCMDRIWRAFERGKRRDGYLFSVLFVDLDRFKIINDSLGHRFGDKLLMEVSRRLKSCVRDLDTVSRFGGDEFIILLEELESPRKAVRVVNRIRRCLREPFASDGHEVRVSASIGIVLGPDQGDSPEDLIQRANIAMHRSKETGRDRFKVFTPRMLDHAELRLTLENDMERAIRNKEFFIEYQPIMYRNGQGMRLFGFEALTRWQHPDRGFISPTEFIPVAEESGQIVSLGQWVLREAASAFAVWRQTVPGADELLLSVNISGRQFAQSDLVHRIMATLDETGLPPDRLKLEITETAIMQNAEMAIDKLSALRSHGVRISVDDFGTGYSSMSYLQKLPLDSLKIDLSFVRGMDESVENMEIIKAIINLAHSLGLEVIAEGVERERHQNALEGLKCEHFQGYFYSRPLPEDKMVAYISGFSAS